MRAQAGGRGGGWSPPTSSRRAAHNGRRAHPRAPHRPAPRPAVRDGYIKRITDPDIQSSVLEVVGDNVSTTYIACPADEKQTLGIKLPFLVMIIKNMQKYFTFEVTILDDKGVRRRFRASNFQVRPGGTHIIRVAA